MRIVARSRDRNMPLSPSIRSHIIRRLRFALAPVETRVKRAYVWVGDENGPRGGPDKYCSVRVDIEGQEAAFVRERHSDLYAAIALAAASSGRAALRAVQRHGRIEHRRIDPDTVVSHTNVLSGGAS